MPLYADILSATRDTIGKLMANRAAPGTVMMNTDGGATAGCLRQNSHLVLTMPTLAPDARLTRAEADRMMGYVLHELAHYLHTDFAAWNRAAREGDPVKRLANACEDMRVELLECAGPWGGFRATVNAMVRQQDAETLATAQARGLVIGSKANDMPWLIVLLGRVDLMGSDIPTAAITRANVAPHLQPILAHALLRIPHLRTTDHAVKLARDLAAMLRSAKPATNAPQPGQGDATKPAKPGQGAGQGDDEGQGAGQGDDEGQGAGQGDDEGQGAGQGDDEGAEGNGGAQRGSGHGNPGPGTSNDTDEDRAGPDSEAGSGETTAPQADPMTSAVASHAGHYMERVPDDTGTTDDARAARARLRGSAVLRDQVAQLVTAQETRAMERRLTAGRLDRRGLVRAGMGARDVYARRTLTEGTNTAVMLLLDLSASMSDDPARLAAARTLALSLASTIDGAGADLAVMGFCSPRSSRYGGPPDLSGKGCVLVPYLDFGGSLARAERRLARVEDRNSSTPLSPAIIAGSRLLVQQDADRHLLCVLTDGDCDYRADGVRAALRVSQNMGVEPFGLGCAFDLAPGFGGIAPYQNVMDLDTLARVGLSELLAQLDGGR